MNEETKNIETCLAENILSEVASVPTDPQFRSLVEESFDPLQQQALRQAGYDGYEKVVWTHKPYTFTSQVKQMKSNLILLLRRLWRFPFGKGTIRSLADMWQHYITRLKGNPEYGIPSRLSQLTDLPSAPALLADRDMSSGIRFGTNHLPDGMSLVNFLCSDITSSVTEIVDDNRGWTINNSRLKSLLSIFTGLKCLTINGDGNLTTSTIADNTTLETLKMPELTAVSEPNSDPHKVLAPIRNLTALETLYAPKLIKTSWGGNGSQYTAVIADCQSLKKAWLGKVNNTNYGGWGSTKWVIQYCEALEELHVAGVVTKNCLVRSEQNANLILLDFTEEQNISADLFWWNPTNVLADADKTATFLSNFKTYIAERLTDNGTGLTLTLSQAVRNAIHAAEDEYGIENIIITQKGWTISPAPN